MTSTLTDDAWNNAYAEASHILDDSGEPMGRKAGGLVTKMRKAGMTASEARSLIVDIKKQPRENVFAFTNGCIARWRAAQ